MLNSQPFPHAFRPCFIVSPRSPPGPRTRVNGGWASRARKGLRVACFACLAGSACLAATDDVEFHRKRLQDIQKKLQEQTKRHEAASTRERSLLDELEQMGARLDGVKREIRDTKRKIEKVSGEIRRAERQLKSALSELKVTGRRLGLVARAWYVSQTALPMRRLANPIEEDLHEMAFAALATTEASEAERLTSRSELVKEKKAALEKVKKSEQKLKAREQNRLAALEQEKQGRDAWLRDVRQEKAASRSAVAELRDAQRQMEELLSLLRKELLQSQAPKGEGGVDLSEVKGAMPWPVAGQVVETFGVHQHPIFRVQVVHQGVTIASEEGAAVKAVGGGRVVHANTMRGYGQIAIVQHGGEMYTLYGQLGQVSVTIGDIVREGSILGYVGEGLRGEPTMYFEVRRGGKALDPMDWLRKK